MKKRIVVEEKNQEDPQALLERIMKAEVTSAERIAEVRKDAEKQITVLQDEAEKTKKEAYAGGKRSRSRLVENGLEKARAEAAERMQQSNHETERILISGKQFIAEAVTNSLSFILGNAAQENSHDK
ncbi:MAG: hypothetical protein AB2L18_04920 [Anaerolineaceae bacterium]